MKVSASVGRGVAPSGRTERHLRQCAACRQYLQQTERMHKVLGSSDRTESALPAFVHGRIMNALELERKPVASQHQLRIRVAGAMAVLALAGIGVWGLRPVHAPVVADEDGGWGNLQPLGAGALQMEKWISQGPGVLTQPLSSEIQCLEQDLMAVAERIDSFLNGALFAALPSENG
jgi:hypothetical protein